MIGGRSRYSPLFAIYGLLPLLGLPLIRLGREMGWHLPAGGTHVIFAVALIYVLAGGWLAYRMTADQVRRDQEEVTRRG